MDAIRHAARLDAKQKDGVTLRAILEPRALKGDESAAAQLEPPEYPESLTYLLDWSRELYGRSGVGMDGFSPLSWEALDAWARRTGRNPTADECQALMLLDSAYRATDEQTETIVTDTAETKVAIVKPWPSKKQEG